MKIESVETMYKTEHIVLIDNEYVADLTHYSNNYSHSPKEDRWEMKIDTIAETFHFSTYAEAITELKRIHKIINMGKATSVK